MLMAQRNRVPKGGQYARTRIVQVLANPSGNRAERRAAAKVARMDAKQTAALPRLAETPKPGRWSERGPGRNGK
jgi:hypothetical protein